MTRKAEGAGAAVRLPGDPAEAIAFFRECRDLLPPSHRARFAAMLGRHEAGVPLADAFWLTPHVGGRTWRVLEPRHARDKKIVEIRNSFLSGLSIKKAARAIAGESCAELPSEVVKKIAAARHGVALPGVRQLETILGRAK